MNKTVKSLMAKAKRLNARIHAFSKEIGEAYVEGLITDEEVSKLLMTYLDDDEDGTMTKSVLIGANTALDVYDTFSE